MSATPPPAINVRFAGLGGTGVIRASDILADVAFRSGREVKKAEVAALGKERERAEKRQQLLAVLAGKEHEDLKSKSVDELRAVVTAFDVDTKLV